MTLETLILVEVTKNFDGTSGWFIEETKLIRSYEGKERATEDLDLLALTCEDRTFKLIPVPYIER